MRSLKKPDLTLKKSCTLIIINIAIAISVLFFLTATAQAVPATFTVTNTNDSGANSLRQAIIDANNNGNAGEMDQINFNISGSTTHTINLQSQLIISQDVRINGYTQTGSLQNQRNWPEPIESINRIEIIGNSSGPIEITSDNVQLDGLVFNFFEGPTLSVMDSANFELTGSYIGTNWTGLSSYYLLLKTADSPELILSGAPNARIGGSLAEDRNIFGGCAYGCILTESSQLQDTENLTIRGNYLGIGADGITGIIDINFASGIILGPNTNNASVLENSIERFSRAGEATTAFRATDLSNLILSNNRIQDNRGRVIILEGVVDSVIGGDDPNIITGTQNQNAFTIRDSVNSPSSNIEVQNNYFGTLEDGLTPFYNNVNNISVEDNSEYIFITNNIIANAGQGGVIITDNSQNISVLQNSIYGNGTLGIDIGEDGVDLNDAGDSDGFANDSLNFPTYSAVNEVSGNTEVDYSLDVPAGDYRIEFYSNDTADSSGFGEGQTFLGFTTVSSTGSPDNLQYILNGVTGVTNLAMTATQIDVGSPNGFGATSEFGGFGAAFPVFQSLGITKTLLSPEDYVQSGQVQFMVTIENDGEQTIDLTNYDGTYVDPFAGSLFTDFLPSYMTIVGVDSGEASCFTGGTLGTLAAPLFANHLDYYAVFCAYTGSDTTFEPGESVEIVYNVDIASDALLNDINYAVPGAVLDDPGYSISSDCFELVGSGNGGDQDAIDCIASSGSDADIGYSGAPTDVEVSKTINAPNGIVAGENVSYELTFTNNGPGDVDLSWYSADSNGGVILFGDIFPSSDLTITGSSSADGIDCLDLGPSSASNLGAFTEDHSGHTLAICYYTNGDSKLLASGESISVTIEATVNNGASSDPVNYLLHFGTSSDEDSAMMSGAIFSATEDNLDEPNMPGGSNFFRLAYLDAEEPGEPGDGGNTGGAGTGANNGAQNGSGLTNTGDNNAMILAIGAVLIGLSAVLVIVRKRRS